MKLFGKNKQSGFSLVELMIVVGIIGVLATLALPRFKQFQAKAKMAEAQNILQHIYTLEQSYSLDYNTYIGVSPGLGANLSSPNKTNACDPGPQARDLGFAIEPCEKDGPTPRFHYDVIATGNTVFSARARTGNGDNNRICTGNTNFIITLSQTNATKWGVGATANTAGAPIMGRVCSN